MSSGPPTKLGDSLLAPRKGSALGECFVASLNDLARRADEGLPAYDNFGAESVRSAGWWFAGAARDLEARDWPEAMRDQLTPSARCRLTCENRPECYACSFGAHERCLYGCEAHE